MSNKLQNLEWLRMLRLRSLSCLWLNISFKCNYAIVIALQFELLKDANIWKDAATQMFFTLSLGFGALIAFASYMPLHNQVMRDAYTVVFVNCGTSLFAGIVVFSILGYREHVTGIPATKVCIACNKTD